MNEFKDSFVDGKLDKTCIETTFNDIIEYKRNKVRSDNS